MKAIVYTAYGQPDVLQLKEVEKPVPKDNEILVRIFATAVNTGDLRLRKADPWAVRLFFGLTKPKKHILGGVLSGEVEALGKKEPELKEERRVSGQQGEGWGLRRGQMLVGRRDLSIKPNNISHIEAGTIPFGGTTALYFIKKANIKEGQKVLIYGASGAVGTAAVQLAKYFGAEVTGVCSTSNVEMVRSLGADKVIDYTKEDFTMNGESYDVIFETVNKLSFSNSIRSLKKRGTLILGASGFSQMLQGLWSSMTSSRKVISGMISQKADDIIFLKELIEKGNFKPVVDRSYPLESIVEAHRYVEQGHKKGSVAITLT